MSEPDPRLLERLFPGPNNKIEIQHRRNVSAAAATAPTGGSNKVREGIAEMCILSSQALELHNQVTLTVEELVFLPFNHSTMLVSFEFI